MYSDLFKKFMFVLIISGIVPMIIISVLTLGDTEKISIAAAKNTLELGKTAVNVSDKALEELGKNLIKEIALGVANQCDLYFKMKPQLASGNRNELAKDTVLRDMATRKIGDRGYVCLYDNNGTMWVHPNVKLHGQKLHEIKATEGLEKFRTIWKASLTKDMGDLYDWKDPDGAIRSKYMYMVNIGRTPFKIAATTYMEEFNQPIKEIKEQVLTQSNIMAAQARQRLGATQVKVVIVAVVGVILGIIMLSGVTKSLVTTVGNLAEITDKVNEGVEVQFDDSLKRQPGELGHLATSVEKLYYSINYMKSRLGE